MFAVTLAAVLVAVPASASTVFSETFDAENGGGSAANYTGFSTLQYRFGPSEADLIRNGDGGIACAGGAGSCLALDGTRAGGGYEIWTRNAYAFNPGDTVTFKLDVGGNANSVSPDLFSFGVSFDGNLVVRDVTLTDRNGTFVIAAGDFFSSGFGSGQAVKGSDPFFTYALSFTAVSAGMVRPVFGIPGLFVGSDDAIGPVADNLLLDIDAAIPEPASWALMIAGFAMTGGAVRRRAKPALA